MSRSVLAYSTLEHSGRLGNQLHQIASTVGLAKGHSMRPLFPDTWSYRDFFSCPDEWFGVVQPSHTVAHTLATRLDRRCRPYLQDLSLWSNVEAEIRAAFQPSAQAVALLEWEWADKLYGLPGPVCAVHIRRGDYATNPIGSITSLPLSYYETALAELQPASVVVFSDDIPWCRENFVHGDLYYEGIPRVKEQDPQYMKAPVNDWVDLFLMASCQQHIISNSTYSWWAAWLSDNKAPLYPSRWFGPEMASFINFRAMIPSGWREIAVKD